MSCLSATMRIEGKMQVSLSIGKTGVALKVRKKPIASFGFPKVISGSLKAPRASAILTPREQIRVNLTQVCPVNLVTSCYGGGYWSENLPWSETEAWREKP